MPIRITGMNSGLDTDAIIQELVSAIKSKSSRQRCLGRRINGKH